MPTPVICHQWLTRKQFVRRATNAWYYDHDGIRKVLSKSEVLAMLGPPQTPTSSLWPTRVAQAWGAPAGAAPVVQYKFVSVLRWRPDD